MMHSAAVSIPNKPARTVVGFGPGSLTKVRPAAVAETVAASKRQNPMAWLRRADFCPHLAAN